MAMWLRGLVKYLIVYRYTDWVCIKIALRQCELGWKYDNNIIIMYGREWASESWRLFQLHAKL